MRRLTVFFASGLAIFTATACTSNGDDLGENDGSGGVPAEKKTGKGGKGGTGGNSSGGQVGTGGASSGGTSSGGTSSGGTAGSTGGVAGSGEGGTGGAGVGGGCNAPLPTGPKYYVDGSCAVDGDGLADGCASSPGAAGAFRNPQSCFDIVQAGDTCLIKNGTYVTTNNGSDPNEDGGFAVANSGSAGNPIVIRAYPGHAPLLANCAPGQSGYCPRPTISARGRSNITFDCLHVQGGFSIYGDSDAQGSTVVPQDTGIVIQNNDITQGWAEYGDGNWAGIWVGQLTNTHVHHNVIHDLSVPSDGGQQSSGTCIKLYHNTNALIEYNTCKHVTIPESQAGGIDDKAQAIDNVHRYNWIEDVNACIRVNNQLNSSGVSVFGNVCIGKPGTQRPAVRLITNINGVQIYNNTFYGFIAGLQIMNEGGPVAGVSFFNNIIANVTNNIEAYQPGLTNSNFNTWHPGAPFLYGGTWYSSLSAFSAATGFDSASAQTDCAFVSPGTDFHLSSGSPCAGSGHTGGVATGASVDRGAYFDGVTCVGQGC